MPKRKTHACSEDVPITYIPDFLTPEDADKIFTSLEKEIPWEQHVTRFGKDVPRKEAWFAESFPFWLSFC